MTDDLEELWHDKCFKPADEIEGKLRARIAELEAQLPEGMKHCTIQFKECPVGHGMLTATNWVQHDCFICRIDELEAEVERLKDQLREPCNDAEFGMKP